MSHARPAAGEPNPGRVMDRPPQATLGVALSGGAARAVAHLGVLEVLQQAGLSIDAVVGTSAGALVGALYASGRFSVAQLIEHVLRIRWRDIVRPAWPYRGLIDSRTIARFVTDQLGSATFSDLAVPFAAVACDLQSGQKVVLSEGPLAPAIAASCSLPVFFTPTEWNGRHLVDGGYVSQIPIRAVRDRFGARTVIGVDVNYRGDEDLPTPGNWFKIAVHLAALLARRNAVEECSYADAMVRVDVRGISLIDLEKAPELLDRGREAARDYLKRFR
jgi:NTE family protein